MWKGAIGLRQRDVRRLDDHVDSKSGRPDRSPEPRPPASPSMIHAKDDRDERCVCWRRTSRSNAIGEGLVNRIVASAGRRPRSRSPRSSPGAAAHVAELRIRLAAGKPTRASSITPISLASGASRAGCGSSVGAHNVEAIALCSDMSRESVITVRGVGSTVCRYHVWPRRLLPQPAS